MRLLVYESERVWVRKAIDKLNVVIMAIVAPLHSNRMLSLPLDRVNLFEFSVFAIECDWFHFLM